jgi:hypothetical protein
VERARPDLEVVRLEQRAPALPPELLQPEDDVLEMHPGDYAFTGRILPGLAL